MKAIQIKQPFEGDGGENTLIFSVPTTGFDDIKFQFAAKNELAATGMLIDYSITQEEEWITTNMTNTNYILSSDYQLFIVDFSNILNASNNSFFILNRFYN